jgi:hypothetical protein
MLGRMDYSFPIFIFCAFRFSPVHLNRRGSNWCILKSKFIHENVNEQL